MRKTNLMLIAALVASPFALALGNIDSLDIDIDKTGNFMIDKDYQEHDTNKYSEVNSNNRDNDALILQSVGNTFIEKEVDNSVYSEEYKFDLDAEIDFYLAKSELSAAVMKNSVNYTASGALCCEGQGPITAATTVYHTNEMDGSFAGAAGVNETAQNVGNNSMLQQSTSTNAALVGHQ